MRIERINMKTLQGSGSKVLAGGGGGGMGVRLPRFLLRAHRKSPLESFDGEMRGLHSPSVSFRRKRALRGETEAVLQLKSS